jgi:hypothetical protein
MEVAKSHAKLPENAQRFRFCVPLQPGMTTLNPRSKISTLRILHNNAEPRICYERSLVGNDVWVSQRLEQLDFSERLDALRSICMAQLHCLEHSATALG